MRTLPSFAGRRSPPGSSLEPLEARIAPAAAVLDLGDIDASNGFVMNGVDASDFTGSSVSNAGDVNGDGFTDLLVGAPYDTGQCYVVFGKAGERSSPFELADLDGTNGFKIVGEAGDGSFGRSVNTIGDFNGDGFDDIVIGSPNLASKGAAYVIFGHGGAFAATLSAGTLNGANGFKVAGQASNNSFGCSVSGAGDLNGDGFDDVIIGAQFATATFHESGASYVLFGGPSNVAAVFDLTTLDGTNGVKIVGAPAREHSGASVSAAGDVNGDGFDDVIIGAPFAPTTVGSYSGASYVVYGKGTGFAAQFDLASIDGTNGFKIAGEVLQDFSGDAVSGLGDVNGDGFDDVIVGAWQSDANGADSGSAFVVFGSASRPSAQLDLASLNGANGFKLRGEAPADRAGRDVSAAGDVNGDGFDDILVGAYGADANGVDAGTAYVVFGKASGFTTEVLLADLDGMNGFKIHGALAGDRAGRGIDAVGDVNGDGLDDLIIGAVGASPNGSFSGASYVVFGAGSGVATVSADGKTATFTDVDGDRVTIKSSKGGLTTDNLQLTGPNLLGGSRLVSADFTDPIFAGSNITITAKAPAGGARVSDGLTNVGSIFAGANALGTVKLDGDLGQIDAAAVKSLTVYSLGLFLASPATSDLASLGALTVKTSVSDANLAVAGKLGRATIGGSVSDVTLAAGTMGAVKIGGDLRDAQFLIGGVVNPTAKQAVALKSLSVGGNVSVTNLLLGYDATGAPVNADVQAGKVAVKGNWIASNLIAGTTAGTDGLFGTADDAVIGGGNAILSRLAGVTIGGLALGGSAEGESFGIVAEQLGALKVGKVSAKLSKTAPDAFALLVRGDFTAREIGAADPLLVALPGANPSVGPAVIEVSALGGGDGFTINGVAADDFSGCSVSDAGDVNGDGFDDLLIGAYGADPNGDRSGTSYVVFGKASGFTASLNLSTLDGTNGFALDGVAADDFSSISVSGAGDVNGDGFDDLIIGAFRADPNGPGSGASYVVFGQADFSATAGNLNLSALDGTNGFKLNGATAGEVSGRSVSGAGDVNGDGFDDLLIGAPYANPNGPGSGASYVVFGRADFSATAGNLELSTLDGSNGFALRGIAQIDQSGFAVSGAGDVNKDGFDDLLIGAHFASPNGTFSGATYVVFGFGAAGVATVAADGKSATYLDVDGDTVTIKSSKGGLTTDNLQLSTPNALGGSRLVSANFTDPIFAGSNLTFTAKAATGTGALGDGLANVGSIFAGANALGSVSIAGDLGQIDAAAVKSLTVYSLGLFPAGSAGSAATSDLASLGALTVKTSVSDANLAVAGKLGKATIGGSVSDAILSAQSAGPVKIGGDLRDARIFLAGVANPATTKLGLALASLSVKGSVSGSQVLTGYDATGTAVNADAAIGKVLIRGNWIASDLAAGAAVWADGLFATADDALIGGGNAIVAKIASITIGGTVLGTAGQDGDGFGFVAEEIGSLKIAKAKAALTKGARNDLAALPTGVTGDVRVREVA